jgi:hypothetical protein
MASRCPSANACAPVLAVLTPERITPDQAEHPREQTSTPGTADVRPLTHRTLERRRVDPSVPHGAAAPGDVLTARTDGSVI